MDFVTIPILLGLFASNAVSGPTPQVTEGTRQPLTRTNSLFGPTGLITIPTAYTARRNEARVGASFSEGIRGPSANYGILDYIEVGGAFLDRDNGRDRPIANAKVSIVPSNFRYFELGVGIIDAFDAIDQTIYFVASADLVRPRVEAPDGSLPVGFKVHLGAGTGIFQEKLFAGGELLFGNRFSVIGEWDTHDFNAAVKYAPNDTTSFQLGIRSTNLFFGMTTAIRF